MRNITVPETYNDYLYRCYKFNDKYDFVSFSLSAELAAVIAEEYNVNAKNNDVFVRSKYSEVPMILCVANDEHIDVVLRNKLMARCGKDKLPPIISAFRATGDVPPELRTISKLEANYV